MTATKLSTVTKNAILIENMLKEIIVYIFFKIINSQDVPNVSNMENFMSKTIISQFQIDCVLKKTSRGDFTSRL